MRPEILDDRMEMVASRGELGSGAVNDELGLLDMAAGDPQDGATAGPRVEGDWCKGSEEGEGTRGLDRTRGRAGRAGAGQGRARREAQQAKTAPPATAKQCEPKRQSEHRVDQGMYCHF